MLTKRSLLYAFPAVCLAILLTLAACGGSGGGGGPRPATLNEAVAAVQGAQTPAQGEFAYNQVASYLLISSATQYQSMSPAQKETVADAFGALIAEDNTTVIGATYGGAITSFNTTFGTSVNVDTAIAQLNADFATANSNPATPARNDLLLILALEGSNATAAKHVSPAAALAMARWFVKRFLPAATPLTRGPCENACVAAYSAHVASLQLVLGVVRAVLTYFRSLNLPPAIAVILESALQTIIGQFESWLGSVNGQYDTCIAACHQQS